MGTIRGTKDTPHPNKTRLFGPSLLILAAGLGAGLAVPAVLQNLDQKSPLEVTSADPLLTGQPPSISPAPPRILAVLDPASLVGRPSPARGPARQPDATSGSRETVPASAGLVVPARPPATARMASANPLASIDPQASTVPPANQLSAPAVEEDVSLLSPSPAPLNLLPEADDPGESLTTTIRVEPGDTLIDILLEAGSSRRDAANAIAAIKPIYDIRKLHAGQNIIISSEPADDGLMHLSRISINAAVDREIQVLRTDDGGYVGEELITELQKGERFTGGEIANSLYLAAGRDNVPTNTIVELIRVFSFGVDFQREIRPGDAYQVLYETFSNEAGETVKQGDLLYAMLNLGSRNLALYRFKSTDEFVDYYDKQGRSIKRLLMRTPVDGARLSSNFGKRRHPILGYTKMHTGTDFAAPRGTPVMAAGNGILKYAGRKGGYGNYISIRHNGTFTTAYAHMNGLARGMKKGKRVRQGQVIGYVGSSGRSTGNHLHYEVRKNGTPVNPMGLRLPVGRELKGKDLKAFRSQIEHVENLMRSASSPLVAERLPAPESGPNPISFSSLPFPGRLR